MTRTLMTALLGAAILIPAHVDAQRVGNRGGDRADTPQRSARLVECRAPSSGRAFVCPSMGASRTVYRYAGNRPSRAYRTRAPLAARAWITPTWARVRYDLRVRGPRHAVVDQRTLRRIVGNDTLRRVREHGRLAGLRGPVRGRWDVRGRGPEVLILKMDGLEVARLVDRDRDGRAEVFLLRNFRRW